MSNPISGNVALIVALNQQLDAGVSRLQAINEPVNQSQNHAYAPGTGPSLANKIAILKESTGVSTPVDVDLTAITCVDDSTGFAHVRELWLFNLDSANPLLTGNDGVVSNAWVPNLTLATTGTVTIQPGACNVVSKPLGTNGYVVDSTHKVVRVDGGAHAVPFLLIVVGD